MQELVKDLTLEYLKNTPVSEELDKAMALFTKLQGRLYDMASTTDSAVLVKMKAGTILTLAVLRKLAEGKDPRKLTPEDWQDIAKQAADYTAYVDGENYALFVFGLYADYIQWSAAIQTETVPKDKIAAIERLSEELRSKGELLKSEEITETAYIEDCLWISLEAMIKLLSAMIYYLRLPSDKAELVQAAASFAFEYGRMRLYQDEQLLLTEYLDHQRQLDAELETRFEDYRARIKANSVQFNELISSAFAPGFRDTLKDSVALARAAGVKEEEILDTVEKVDSFFLD